MPDDCTSDGRFARWAADSLRAALSLIRLERRGVPFEPTALRVRAMSRADATGADASNGIPPALAAREEPEVHLAWQTLRSVLEHFELLVGDDAVEPDAFTLRRTADWAFEQDSPAAMLTALARPCPYRCEFCYEDGLSDAARPIARPLASRAELDLRLALWREGRDVAGFQGLRYGEILPHPRFAEALDVVRRVTDRPIAVATAGAGLSEEKLRALAGRPRVLVQLSLNTCDPARREHLMGDPRATKLLRLVPRFHALDVAWAASAVAWPGLPLDDLEATVRVAEEHGALHFVVFLPSFSKYFPLKPPFDWEARWRETVQFVRALRAKVRIPVRVAPDSWEAAECFADPLAVEVVGVTIGSAADGKLGPGDILTAVGPADPVAQASGLRPRLTRPAANRALEQAWGQRRKVTLRVTRGGRETEIVLSADADRAAHPGELDAPFGVHIYDGPDENHLARAVELLRFAGARSGWVLSARLLARPYERLWKQVRGPLGADDVELRFVPVENRFWGGNIMVGDLLTAADFVHAVRAERAAGQTPPEALLVPFSPFHPTYWRDLTGASFLQIERRTGLPTFPLITRSQP